MWLQTYKYQHNLNYPRYKVHRLYIVQCSIFCFWLKSYWKKAHYYSNDAISSITVQGQVESPMHLQIMAASTRDFAYNSYQKKKPKNFWSNYHHFHWLWCFSKITLKHSVVYLMRSNNDKGTHTEYLISMPDKTFQIVSH